MTPWCRCYKKDCNLVACRPLQAPALTFTPDNGDFSLLSPTFAVTVYYDCIPPTFQHESKGWNKYRYKFAEHAVNTFTLAAFLPFPFHHFWSLKKEKKQKTKTLLLRKLKNTNEKKKTHNLQKMHVHCNNRRNPHTKLCVWRDKLRLVDKPDMIHTWAETQSAVKKYFHKPAFHLLSAQHQPNQFCSCQKHFHSQVIFNFPQCER